MNVRTITKKLRGMSRGIAQRVYYLKHLDKGFNIVFLIPGSIREKIFGEHTFFRAITSNIKEIKLEKEKDGLLLTTPMVNLLFPPGCFYEGDFFDIIYPKLDIRDSRIQALVYDNPYYQSEGQYENFGVRLTERDCVIDAGANIGMFSVVASKKIGKTGQVIAFEPMKEISSILEKNSRRNDCKNIRIENYLLGETNKSVDFFYNLKSNYNGASTKLHSEGDTTIQLEQITLDEFVKKNNITKVDFIKADIEGAERDLLKGARETLKKYRPKLALRTYHLPDDREVLFGLVKEIVPEYTVVLDKETLYAWIDKEN